MRTLISFWVHNYIDKK